MTIPSCVTQVPSWQMSLATLTSGEALMEPDWEELLQVAQREARRLLNDEFRADDIAATVMKRIWSRLSRIDADELKAYVRRSVLNEVRDQYRREHTDGGRPRLNELPDEEAMRRKPIGSARRWMVSSPSNQAIRRERDEHVAEVLGDVLAGLSDRQRLLLTLAADETHTNEHIAQELGYANADTVKATLSRLRKRLREQFGADIDELLREW